MRKWASYLDIRIQVMLVSHGRLHILVITLISLQVGRDEEIMGIFPSPLLNGRLRQRPGHTWGQRGPADEETVVVICTAFDGDEVGVLLRERSSVPADRGAGG